MNEPKVIDKREIYKKSDKPYENNLQKDMQSLINGEYDLNGTKMTLGDALLMTAIQTMMNNGCPMSDLEKLFKMTGDLKEKTEITVNTYEEHFNKVTAEEEF